jgi:transglutaminase-like putative cysteine protease
MMQSHRAFVGLLTLCLISPSLLHAQATTARPAETSRVSLTLQYRITGKPGTDRVVLTALVPKTLEGRQKILSVKYSVRPEKEFEENGNKYARFALEKPAGLQLVSVNVAADLYRYDLTVAAREQRRTESKEKLKPWLVQEKFIEKDAPEVLAAAKLIPVGDELDMVRAIMAFVHQKVRYTGFDDTDHGAVWALKNGRGDCTEFSDLFVAICRAKNIPARVWEGYMTSDVAKNDTPKHIRVEVYTKQHGWVPFDPLHVARKNATFEILKPNFLYLSSQRNDTILQNYHFASYRYFGQPVTFETGFTVGSPR